MGDPDKIKWEEYSPQMKFSCVLTTIGFLVVVGFVIVKLFMIVVNY